ncbi:hypothetical protein CAPTEDRAFT_223597 [Capitella teleta]|uniref:Dihydrolipoamide acetyltransferase component of pyruvate dehydrogenase complex n=1 Tax=Capitella teleta TaxID=283909 RepID=R7TVP4_CAPTE|nr:hypothetical protein CAPTEDRAFT_223597 [Capitella teleta]|eukprot:ELT97657.1 hypothetical protein CAPTEDRAFT_223597 [Capitella teleta]
MPSLSPTMTEGQIVEWLKKEGDAVSAGDLLCSIQTDKTVVGMEIDEDGILAKILVPTDSSDKIQINTPIALLVEEGEDWQNVEIPSEVAGAAAPSAPTSPDQGESHAFPDTPLTYGPAVRSILDIYSLSPSQLVGTGPHGRLLKGDLLRYIQEEGLKPAPVPQVALPVGAPVSAATPPPSPPPPSSLPPSPPSKQAPLPADDSMFEDIPLTNIRSIIAKRLTESKMGTPHAYSVGDCAIGNILQLRKDLADDGVKVSVNDFIVKACAVALQRVPAVNAQWSGGEVRLLSDIDISVAVATPSGLITPIVKDAIGLGLEGISSTTKELAKRARENKLKPEEFQGGSFTVSNLGMFGISHFTAIINPPQAAILAVGGSRMVLDPETEAPVAKMSATLCYDERVIDDSVAAEFMQTFKEVMQNPMLMLSQSKPINLKSLFERPS